MCLAINLVGCTSAANSKQLPRSKFAAGQKHGDILIETILILNWLIGLILAKFECLMCGEVTPKMSKLSCAILFTLCVENFTLL